MWKSDNKFITRIFRGSVECQYWEEFPLEEKPGMNVISALMEIQRNPINMRGERRDPVIWEMSCLEEVCGACSMLINGIPRQACAALVADILQYQSKRIISLAPLSKFPLVRDLQVDRSSMFHQLQNIRGWIPIEEKHSESFGPKISPRQQESRYIESTCMTCGCCLEACPMFNEKSKFIGAAAINQAKLFNTHPTGAFLREERLHFLMQKGGVSDCGNAQNCAAVCPKKIPLARSITYMGRDLSKRAVQLIFGWDE